MGKNRTKIRLVSIIAALLVVINFGELRAAADPSAIFYLSPSSSTVNAASNFSVELRITVTNDISYAARARLTYPVDKLEVTSVQPSSGLLPVENSINDGTIVANYGSFSGITGDKLFATINFKAKDITGNANVVIDPIIDANEHSYVAGASKNGENILNRVSGGAFTIIKTSAAPVPSSPVASSTQSKPPASPTQENSDEPSVTGDDIPVSQTTKTITPDAASAESGDRSPNTSFFDRTVVLAALPAIILASLAARQINRRYRRRKLRRSDERHETVAEIASRLSASDKTKETVAELAARLKRTNPSEETVAEIAARLGQKRKHGVPWHSSRPASRH